jgi:hypothetical protein
MSFLRLLKTQQNRKLGTNGQNTDCGTKTTGVGKAFCNCDLELHANILLGKILNKHFVSI